MVSIGVSVMRKQAEAKLAATVLTSTGQGSEERRARIPALAAVSPNRERGPWNLIINLVSFKFAKKKERETIQGVTYKAAAKPA